jgi:hypothetical protein
MDSFPAVQASLDAHTRSFYSRCGRAIFLSGAAAIGTVGSGEVVKTTPHVIVGVSTALALLLGATTLAEKKAG